MKQVSLSGLEGTNPLGFLAALGVLEALVGSGYEVKLRWTDDLVPHAVIAGVEDPDELVAVLDRERKAWIGSVVLGYPEDAPLLDAKPPDGLLRGWFANAFEAVERRSSDVDLLCALVAEGALDGKQNAKPTHLHFTAGQQRFLEMVRTLAGGIDKERLAEAVYGPWTYTSPLPSLSWDAARGERVYAVRATNPSNEKRLGVPGADWLAFRGLVFYPVHAVNGSLRTTACNSEWKRSAFRWPLWTAPATRSVVGSLVADRTLVSRGTKLRPRDLAARGVSCVLEAPIRRTDQGGYGTFGGPATIAVAA